MAVITVVVRFPSVALFIAAPNFFLLSVDSLPGIQCVSTALRPSTVTQSHDRDTRSYGQDPQ